MIWSAIRRGFAVLFGFFMAALAGAIVLFIAGARWAAEEVTSHMQPGSTDMDRLFGEWLGAVAFAFTVAPVLTLLPALVVIIGGEVARIRSLLYYVVGAGVAAAAMPLIAMQPTPGPAAYSAPYFSILATAGFAGGLVYWLIAGRRA